MRRHRERDEGGSGGRARAEVVKGETASICQGVRERMHLREAEERDVVFERDVVVLGVLELLGDLDRLRAAMLVIIARPYAVPVNSHLRARAVWLWPSSKGQPAPKVRGVGVRLQTSILEAALPWVQCAAVMAHCSSISEAPHE